MVFSCGLCREACEEWLLVSSHCSKCCEIRRIISLYSTDKVLETLRFVYLRDEDDKRDKRSTVEKMRKAVATEVAEIVTRSKSQKK